MSISGVSAGSSYASYGSARMQTPARSDSSSTASSEQLSTEQLAEVRKLQARDRAVRQHEQAHLSAAGGLVTSGPSYSYQRGPDGVNYAIGGEVSIDVSPGRTAQETIDKAKQIEQAALAPKDPSGADRAVAAQARNMAQKARSELAAAGQTDESANTSADADQQDASASEASNTRQTEVSNRYQGASQPNSRGSLLSAFA